MKTRDLLKCDRTSVATFTTDVLTDDITFSGELMAKLNISCTSTDADFIVKLIDIYPENEAENPDKPNVVLQNYHQLVRSEIMPARFRNSIEKPEALVPNQKTAVDFKLQDVCMPLKKDIKYRFKLKAPGFSTFCSQSAKIYSKCEFSDESRLYKSVYPNLR